MKLTRKLLVISFVMIFAVMSISMVGYGAGDDMIVLHTNDIHGRIEIDDDYMGFPYIASVIEEYRENYEHVLVLDAGDAIHGRPITDRLQGESTVETMNFIGYDVMTIGNHEFNFGYERLLELADMAEFDLIAANVEKDGELLFNPYVIREVGNYTVGIFGLATSATYSTTHPDNIRGIDFTDMAEATERYVDILRNDYGVDMVIGLGHIGLSASSDVVTQVAGVDLFVDGHSHSLLREGEWHNDTLIVQANEYTKYLGKVEIGFETDGPEMTASVMAFEDVTAEFNPNEDVVTMLEDYRAEVRRIMLGN